MLSTKRKATRPTLCSLLSTDPISRFETSSKPIFNTTTVKIAGSCGEFVVSTNENRLGLWKGEIGTSSEWPQCLEVTPDKWCCWFFSTTLNDLLTTVLTSYVLFTRSLFCSKWIRSDTEMDRFCSHGTTSSHEQSVYTEPFCCCPLLEAQVETRTGPRRHRIVCTYKKAEY